MRKLILILIVILKICLSESQNTNDVPKKFGMCPPSFVRIHSDCFYFSSSKENWFDSHIFCKEMNSKLAEPLKYSDKRLRKYLKSKDRLNTPKWIGGTYNWKNAKWQWGSGKDMVYQAFEQFDHRDNKNLDILCATMDPAYFYRWSAKMCIERHNFICQKPVTLVNGNNNHRRIQAAPTASTMRPHDRTQAFSHDVLSYSHNNGRINREKRKGKEIGENIDLGLKSDRKIKRTKKTRKNTKAPITANNTTQAIKIEETRPTKSSQVVHKNVAETSISTPVPKVLSSSKVASKNYTPEEKRNRLKAKLANLSPEERAEFFAKKRERDARKRKQNSVQ